MTISELITIIGIVATFVVGVINLIVIIRNAKRNTFTSSVTSSRIRYIQDIRQSISKFCGLAHLYNTKRSGLSPQQLSEIHKEVDSLRYLIRLFLNPEDKYWDTQIMTLCDEVIKNTDMDSGALHNAIESLIKITQYLLKLEWQGIKEEANKGALTDQEKTNLYQHYVALHQKRLSQ
jgi:hypothetical protein